MKTTIKGLLVVFGLTNSIVDADLLGDADDTCSGFQMAIPIGLNPKKVSLVKAEYSFLLAVLYMVLAWMIRRAKKET
jgi:hypothetical protein